MKKSLLALAVLGAFAGAASAQSSVTIYGIIDVGVAKINDGTSPIGATPNAAAATFGDPGVIGTHDVWHVRSSTSSRLGFRGTEDLGGGMKANFQIEHRLDPSNGQNESGAAAMWHGASWVGVSGGFGEVGLGRQYVPMFYTGLAMDPWGYDYNVAGAAGYTRANSFSRANNAVTYLTPNFGGFTGQVQVAAGEGVAASSALGNTGNRLIGFNVRYTAGPLDVGLGYNDIDDPTTNRHWNLVGSWDLGMVKPIVGYASGETTVGDTKQWLIGARAPIGPGTLKAVYARSSLDPAGAAAEFDTSKFGFGYEYALSKRTSVHADYGSAKTDGLTRSNGFEVGLKHVF